MCCWDTGSVLHFPVPVYPPRPDSYIGGGRGRVEGGGWRWPGPTQCVWVTRCGAGAACCPPQRCSPLQRRHWPQHAPRLQPQSWPGHRDRVSLHPAAAVTRQQQPSKCGVETRGPEPHCYCLSGGKVHVSIRLDNLPLVVFSPLPSVCLHRRLTAVQVARVGRWDQASSSAAIVVTRKRPVASLQPGPGSRLGPRLPQDRSCRAVLGAAAARLSSAIHNYHLGRDQPSLRAWPRPDQVTNTRTPELCQAQAAGTQSFQNLRARLEDRYRSGLQ